MPQPIDLSQENWAHVTSYNTPESAPIQIDVVSLIDNISNANIDNILWDVQDREYVN